MQIIIVRENQTKPNAISQVNNSLISYIGQAFNYLTSGNTESLIFPIVPKDIKFPRGADVENYKGVTESFNIPSYKNLEEITIQSIFPVYKNYTFANSLANANGWDYVDFLEERQKSQLPLRLLAYDYRDLPNTIIETVQNGINAGNIFRRYADGLFLVKNFDYDVDKVKDINYTLTLSQFNSDSANFAIDWGQLTKTTARNVTTKYVLKNLGLI